MNKSILQSLCCNADIKLSITINQMPITFCKKCYKYNPEIKSSNKIKKNEKSR